MESPGLPIKKIAMSSDVHAPVIQTPPNLTLTNEIQTTIRSPRLSPLHKFDTMMMETHKKVNSDFPVFVKHSRTQSKNQAISNGVPETIEEDKKEEDSQPKYVRRSRFPEMRDHNEFGKKGKRFRSEEG